MNVVMIKITNIITGAIMYKQIEGIGWNDTGKEIGASMWGVDWDSIKVERM